MRGSAHRVYLVHFISDLLRNARLRDQVIQHPERAMKKYGLSGAQIAILKTQDKALVSLYMGAEIYNQASDFMDQNRAM